MEERWASWRSFENSELSGYLEAPVGPGVYEIRQTSDRALVKLSFTTNIAHELSIFLARGKGSQFLFWTHTPYANGELEYRFWSVNTRAKAKTTLRQIKEQRANANQERAWRVQGRGA